MLGLGLAGLLTPSHEVVGFISLCKQDSVALLGMLGSHLLHFVIQFLMPKNSNLPHTFLVGNTQVAGCYAMHESLQDPEAPPSLGFRPDNFCQCQLGWGDFFLLSKCPCPNRGTPRDCLADMIDGQHR